jgi:hypothetical protein
MMELNIQDDSVTHINVYTKGATILGRMMSNLANSSIEHPRYGHFRTLEGLWYYLKTGLTEDSFRVLQGYECRKAGKDILPIWNTNFHRDFKIGIVLKILANSELKILLEASTLPFVHYYYYGNVPGKQKLIVPRGHEWQVEFWDSMRRQLKEGKDLNLVIEGLMKIEPTPAIV